MLAKIKNALSYHSHIGMVGFYSAFFILFLSYGSVCRHAETISYGGLPASVVARAKYDILHCISYRN